MTKPKKKTDLVLRGRDGSTWIFKHKLAAEFTSDADFAQHLRAAIRESGVSQYHLAEVADVPQGAISVFLSGGDLKLSTFSRLAQAMGMALTHDPAKGLRKVGPASMPAPVNKRKRSK
jgi:hypothetical protein